MTVRVRGILEPSRRAELVRQDRWAVHGGRVAAGEKVANVDGRTLERILQAEGVHDEHRVVEVELRA